MGNKDVSLSNGDLISKTALFAKLGKEFVNQTTDSFAQALSDLNVTMYDRGFGKEYIMIDNSINYSSNHNGKSNRTSINNRLIEIIGGDSVSDGLFTLPNGDVILSHNGFTTCLKNIKNSGLNDTDYESILTYLESDDCKYIEIQNCYCVKPTTMC